MTWREKSKSHINRLLNDNPHDRGDSLRKILRDGYPFRERRGQALKVWQTEVRLALQERNKEHALREYWTGEVPKQAELLHVPETKAY